MNTLHTWPGSRNECSLVHSDSPRSGTLQGCRFGEQVKVWQCPLQGKGSKWFLSSACRGPNLKLTKIMLNLECNKYKLFDFTELILKTLPSLIHCLSSLIGACSHLGYFLEWLSCLLAMWLTTDAHLACFSSPSSSLDEAVQWQWLAIDLIQGRICSPLTFFDAVSSFLDTP